MKYLDKTDWTKTNLDSVTTIIGDGLHGTPKYNEAGKYYFINGRNLQGKILIDDKTKRVDETEYRKYKKKLNNRTIFLSINGTIGNIAEYNEQKIILGKSVCYLNVNDDVNKKFIKYELMTPQFKNYSDNYSSGTTIKNLGLKEIREYEFDLPPYEEQEKISKVLNILDNKIENNNAIISNLEEQAQAIFKSWFIDFEPFQDGNFVDSELGEIPEGWCVVSLKDISKNIITGKTPSTKDIENYGNEVPFITIPDMHNQTYVVKTERKLSSKGINTQLNKYLYKNSVITSCIATVGLVSLVSEPSHTNQQINGVVPKENISPYFIYLYLKRKKKYLNNIGSSGSTTKNVNKTTFSNLRLVLPSQNILDKLDSIYQPIFEYILRLQYQNQNLAQLRDTLLPKLMSGELRLGQDDIEDIESQI